MYVYADNAATTQMSQVAINAMLPYLDKVYGNPSSLHSVGQEAKEALEAARETVAKCLGCQPREIYFTSGGSEADNQAIISAARLGARKGKKHIISTAFEHHAVLHTVDKLAKEGNPSAIPFPRAHVEGCPYDFSFSGLKSAVLNYLHHAEQKNEEINEKTFDNRF